MSILPPHPEHTLVDASRFETIVFTSPADGTSQQVNVFSPSTSTGEPLPLVLAPHPITWTPEQEYQGGWDGMQKWGYHRGYYGLSDEYGVIIALPHGHHRREEFCSLAAPEQIADMAYLVDALDEHGYRVDKGRVYVCGKSMGGQEALVLAGRYPEKLAAAVAFNPIIDLAAWQEDLANSPLPEIREFGTDKRIANEVGGLPAAVPALYAQRSATTYADGLAQVPTLIFWTEVDSIVPRQITHHTMKLYEMVKARAITSPIAEYNHTKIHAVQDFGGDIGWQLHEWCDYELALRWMLVHQK
jgi:poly(3-hydroxybutyrate) depolymerase